MKGNDMGQFFFVNLGNTTMTKVVKSSLETNHCWRLQQCQNLQDDHNVTNYTCKKTYAKGTTSNMLCNTILKRILQDIILPQLHLQKNLSKGEQEQHAMQDHSEKDFTRHHSSIHNSFFSPCVLPLVICLFLFFCPFSLLNQLHLHSCKNFYEERIAKEEMELAWKGC